MTISAAPLIYILIFVAVLMLVEGLYLTVFGKSISLNSRLSRRLSLLEKVQDREKVLEQLRKEMSQHVKSRGIPLYSILATKAQKANIAFTPPQLIGIMGGLGVFSYLGLTLGTDTAHDSRCGRIDHRDTQPTRAQVFDAIGVAQIELHPHAQRQFRVRVERVHLDFDGGIARRRHAHHH